MESGETIVKGRRGDPRRSYTTAEKLVVLEMASQEGLRRTARSLDIPKSTISRWRRESTKIADLPLHKRADRGQPGVTKYPALERRLLAEIGEDQPIRSLMARANLIATELGHPHPISRKYVKRMVDRSGWQSPRDIYRRLWKYRVRRLDLLDGRVRLLLAVDASSQERKVPLVLFKAGHLPYTRLDVNAVVSGHPKGRFKRMVVSEWVKTIGSAENETCEFLCGGADLKQRLREILGRFGTVIEEDEGEPEFIRDFKQRFQALLDGWNEGRESSSGDGPPLDDPPPDDPPLNDPPLGGPRNRPPSPRQIAQIITEAWFSD